MRLIVNTGYRMLLFPTTCELSPIINALGAASVVEESGPWGNRVYAKVAGAEIEVKLVPDDDVRLPDVPRAPELEKIISLAKERDEALAKVYTLEAQLKKIGAAVTPPAAT